MDFAAIESSRRAAAFFAQLRGGQRLSVASALIGQVCPAADPANTCGLLQACQTAQPQAVACQRACIHVKYGQGPH